MYQAKSGSTEKNPSTIDRIQTKSNVRSTRATARNLRIDPDIIKMSSSNKHGYARVSEPSEFSKCLHIRSSLNSLSSFSGGPIQRFESWLDTFERIVNNSGFSDEEMVLELYKKMIDRAQKVTKYVLESGADEYTTVKARLIDHFYGYETVEKYLKKFEKASKKPGEKLCDFAIRLREIFKYAYPDA